MTRPGVRIPIPPQFRLAKFKKPQIPPQFRPDASEGVNQFANIAAYLTRRALEQLSVAATESPKADLRSCANRTRTLPEEGSMISPAIAILTAPAPNPEGAGSLRTRIDSCQTRAGRRASGRAHWRSPCAAPLGQPVHERRLHHPDRGLHSAVGIVIRLRQLNACAVEQFDSYLAVRRCVEWPKIVTSSTPCQSRYVPGATGAGAAMADAETKAANRPARMFNGREFMR